MSSPLHSKQTTSDGIHTPVAFAYADQAARVAASGFSSTDLNKIALQQSDNSLWLLIDTSTPTWKQIGGSGPWTESGGIVSLVNTADTQVQMLLGSGSGIVQPLTITTDFVPGAYGSRIPYYEIKPGSSSNDCRMSIRGADNPNGTAGYVVVAGGNGSSGGGLYLAAGQGDGSNGGNATLTSGGSNGGHDTGSLEIRTPNSQSGLPGSMLIQAGAAQSGSGNGGDLLCHAGAANGSGIGGTVELFAGDGVGGGGNLSLHAGNSVATNGNITIRPGIGSGSSGTVTIGADAGGYSTATTTIVRGSFSAPYAPGAATDWANTPPSTIAAALDRLAAAYAALTGGPVP